MEKLKLFEKKYVHFMWDDALEGKKCIVGDTILELMNNVNQSNWIYHCFVEENTDSSFPFKADDGCKYCFAYYDPLYEYKKAWFEDKVVQVWNNIRNEWLDVKSNELWTEHAAEAKYRFKPEEETVGCKAVSDAAYSDAMFVVKKPVMGLWQSTVCEIRAEIRSYEGTADDAKYRALSLCNVLEESMCAACGGDYPLMYTITEDFDKEDD